MWMIHMIQREKLYSKNSSNDTSVHRTTHLPFLSQTVTCIYPLITNIELLIFETSLLLLFLNTIS